MQSLRKLSITELNDLCWAESQIVEEEEGV
jgi:hypothetical protein